MLYQSYEMQRLALTPMRLLASNAVSLFGLPGVRDTTVGRVAGAWFDAFEHTTRYFGKPAFGHTETIINGQAVAVTERVTLSETWCDLLRFERASLRPHDPKLLIVAPMSGHYATLLRGTVEAFLPDHDVTITDWKDAREVPLADGRFDLDDYVDSVIRYVHHLGPDTHVLAVCQPAVPVLAAVALMNADRDPLAPASMTLIGGPIDTRCAPTKVNEFAKRHDIDWFRNHVIDRVPYGHPGFLRDVYPGFLQLAGFLSMNLDRHMEAHWQMFQHLVQGDGESLASKRAFYEEYRSVMDLDAAYYLQTIATVFQEHALPRGIMTSRNRRVDPSAIERTAMFTIEGERDDISGIGQTRAAHALTTNLPETMRDHLEQPGVGHYGLFNGRRFNAEVAPRIKAFIAAH